MKSEQFIEYSKDIVRQYADMKQRLESDEPYKEIDVYIVWYCFELGHNKALLSTNVEDGRYYEVTYNSIKNEIYLDAYKKENNECFKIK